MSGLEFLVFSVSVKCGPPLPGISRGKIPELYFFRKLASELGADDWLLGGLAIAEVTFPSTILKIIKNQKGFFAGRSLGFSETLLL